MRHCAKVARGPFWVKSDRSLDRHEEAHRAVLLGVRAAGVIWINLGAVLRLPHLAQLGEWRVRTIRLAPRFLDPRVDLLPDERCGKNALSLQVIPNANIRLCGQVADTTTCCGCSADLTQESCLLLGKGAGRGPSAKRTAALRLIRPRYVHRLAAAVRL
jgi:hypothetical protein